MQRYQTARELGFSSQQASRMRDLSRETFENVIASERRRISRKSRSARTSQEISRVEAIRAYEGSDELTRSRRLDAGGTRYENFRRWSSKFEGFPYFAFEGDDIFPGIEEFNLDSGRTRDDGFGYRAFYYYYVERIMDIGVIERLADRGDSGVYPGGIQGKIRDSGLGRNRRVA